MAGVTASMRIATIGPTPLLSGLFDIDASAALLWLDILPRQIAHLFVEKLISESSPRPCRVEITTRAVLGFDIRRSAHCFDYAFSAKRDFAWTADLLAVAAAFAWQPLLCLALDIQRSGMMMCPTCEDEFAIDRMFTF